MLNFIKTHYKSCVRTSCSENNSKLDINGINDILILKGELTRDQHGETFRICDYIIFNQNFIVLAELKNPSSAKPSKIRDQLDGCSKIVIKILKECNKNINDFQFIFLAVSKGWKSSKYNLLASKSVNVYGKKHKILPISSGYKLARLLN